MLGSSDHLHIHSSIAILGKIILDCVLFEDRRKKLDQIDQNRRVFLDGWAQSNREVSTASSSLASNSLRWNRGPSFSVYIV